MEEADDDRFEWIAVGREVAKGRRERSWAGDNKSVSDWIDQVAKRVGKSPNLVRRWAAIIEFIETFAGRGRIPHADELYSIPPASLELVVRAHALAPSVAARLIGMFDSPHPPTVRQLREQYDKLSADRAGRGTFDLSTREYAMEHLGSIVHKLSGGVGNSFIFDGHRHGFKFSAPDLIVAQTTSQEDVNSNRTKWYAVDFPVERYVPHGGLADDSQFLGGIELAASFFECLWLVVPFDHEATEMIVNYLPQLRISSCGVIGCDALAGSLEELLAPSAHDRRDRREIFHDEWRARAERAYSEPLGPWAHVSSEPCEGPLYVESSLWNRHRRHNESRES